MFKCAVRILLVLMGSFVIIELYYQFAFRYSAVLPSFLRIYDFRYFDAEGTPRFLQNTDAWHNSYQGREQVAIHINSQGFRGSELLELPSFRIAMIGDSTVFNGGVELQETFPFLVQETLRKEADDPGIEVLNLGVSDTNIHHYYLKLKNHALGLRPNLVLVFIYLNDAMDSMASITSSTTRSAITPWYHSFAFEELSRFFRNINLLYQAKVSSRFDWVGEFQDRHYLYDRDSWERMRSQAEYDWGSAWREESWRTIEYRVSEMLKLTQGSKTELQFVILPVAPQVQIREASEDLFLPQQLAARMADRLHIHLLDPLAFLRESADRDQLFYDQCHLTALGNRAMAEFLAAKLKDKIQ